MATAASNQSIGTTEQAIYSSGNVPGATSFLVRCRADSSNDLLVSVPGLHADGEYFLIPIGQQQIFRDGDGLIRQVLAKGSGGAAKADYGVVART